MDLEVAASDFANLINAITDAGGGRRIMIFMCPGRAIALSILAPGLALARDLGGEIATSPVIPNNQIIAVDPAGFMSAFGPDPDFEASQQTEIVFQDTAPPDVGTPGAPATVGAPAKSMFQTQSTAIRLILRCAWAMRAPGLVQSITAVNW